MLALPEPGLPLPDYVVCVLEKQGIVAQPVELDGLEALFPTAPPAGLLLERGDRGSTGVPAGSRSVGARSMPCT